MASDDREQHVQRSRRQAQHGGRSSLMSRGLHMAALAALLVVWLQPAAAADDAAQAEIRATLAQWTADFNARNTDKVCGIFEPDVAADIRTEPEQNYEMVCERLKRSLTDPARTYNYSSSRRFSPSATWRWCGSYGRSRSRAARKVRSNPSRRAWISSAAKPTAAGRSCGGWRTINKTRSAGAAGPTSLCA